MTAHFTIDLGIDMERRLNDYSICEQSGRILPDYDKRQSLVVVSPYKIRKKRKSV